MFTFGSLSRGSNLIPSLAKKPYAAAVTNTTEEVWVLAFQQKKGQDLAKLLLN
jgi:hypothetical protein